MPRCVGNAGLPPSAASARASTTPPATASAAIYAAERARTPQATNRRHPLPCTQCCPPQALDAALAQAPLLREQAERTHLLSCDSDRDALGTHRVTFAEAVRMGEGGTT